VPFLRFIARVRLRELFTAAALLIVVGMAYGLIRIGFSPALGAFLAGVVLASSEFRHQLESDIEPFKGVLLGLFFIAVGASINFRLIVENPLLVMGLVLGIVFIKAVVTGATGRLFGLSFDQNVLFTVVLSQIGEFAFVLFTFIGQLRLLPETTINILMGVTATSMIFPPILMPAAERLILPYFGTRESASPPPPDAIEGGPSGVIIAGFGHFGSTIGRFLRANGVAATILDNDSDRVDVLRRMGFTVFYGDATRMDILKSAGADEAGILIAAIDSPEINHDLMDRVRREFPNLDVMVRAKSREDAYELLGAGVKNIYRESLDTSIRLGVDVLVKLGFRRYTALRAGQNFLKYDEQALRTLAEHRHDRDLYIFKTREQIELQEQLLSIDREKVPNLQDAVWDDDRGEA
jgi:CPA2 family monovalent cation:H+ antiporter-2